MPGHENESTVLCSSTFQTLDNSIYKNIQVNTCGFICDNYDGPLNKSARFIEIH